MAIQEQQQRLAKLIPSVTSPPPGIDPVAWASVYIPAGNELTTDRIALGRKLYFDTRLSKDGTLACATCHDVSRECRQPKPARAAVIGDPHDRRYNGEAVRQQDDGAGAE
jgi:cytochrome c peroxidase